MAKRQIITIDEEKCNGCGLCVTGCHEGALQIVNGKAKLVNESFCDGFGDCIGECPTGALVIEEREAKEFDLDATAGHVRTLRGDEAVEEMMKAQEVHEVKEEASKHNHGGGCPGSQAKSLKKSEDNGDSDVEVQSTLQQWPVQISLLSPFAPYFKNADLLITADCVPFAYGDYHRKLLKGKAVAIGCPKLDDAEAYVDKLATIIANNDLKSINVARMEVPCCGGMVRITEEAVKRAGVDIEVEIVTIGIDGKVKN